MKSILISIAFLSGGFYCSFINQSENVYNLMLAYSILGIALSPICFLAPALMKDEDIKKAKNILTKQIFNTLWIGIWIKMILVGYLVTGIFGLFGVLACHIMLAATTIRIKEMNKEEV